MDKKEELIKTYRNQISLKSDIIKGKNDELKNKDEQYKKEIKNLKDIHENTTKNNILKHNKDIEELRNAYNELLYTSERKCMKLMNSQKSYLWG